MEDKKTVAVFFGGQSTEHDISIIAGMAVLKAIDRTKYDVEPIYIDMDGKWYNGEALLNPYNFHLSERTKRSLNRVEFPVGRVFNQERPHCDVVQKASFFGEKKIYFDIAFLAFLGAGGEDGLIQGVFSTARIPFVNSGVQASAVFMNKVLTKMILRSAGIPVLSEMLLRKPEVGMLNIDELIKDQQISYPVCVKPVNLGSSVGVNKATNADELKSALVDVFRLDHEAMIEPFIENLVEYNVAVTKSIDGKWRCSVIEKPLRDDAIQSFQDKYLRGAKAGGGKFGGFKLGGSKMGMLGGKFGASQTEDRLTQGMAAMGREFNPEDLTDAQRKIICESAIKAVEIIGAAGTPRVDYICNSATGELWLNEVNTMPGNVAYYLWEASEPRIPFTKLIDGLIDESYREATKISRNIDLKSAKANLFPDR